MKNNLTLILLSWIAIVFGCAAEELLPKVAGVGFPVLMSAVVAAAPRREWFSLVVFAVAAGGAEDAVSSLPVMTSPVFFLAVAALVRRWELPAGAGGAFYPLYQVWLALWPSGVEGPLFVKILTALPLGAVTLWATGSVGRWLERKAAADEAV